MIHRSEEVRRRAECYDWESLPIEAHMERCCGSRWETSIYALEGSLTESQPFTRSEIRAMLRKAANEGVFDLEGETAKLSDDRFYNIITSCEETSRV